MQNGANPGAFMADVREALLMLGVSASFESLVRRVRRLSPTTANEALADWKVQVLKPAYKAQAFVSHPDKGGSTNAMVAITKAYDLLKGLRFMVPHPPQSVRMHAWPPVVDSWFRVSPVQYSVWSTCPSGTSTGTGSSTTTSYVWTTYTYNGPNKDGE